MLHGKIIVSDRQIYIASVAPVLTLAFSRYYLPQPNKFLVNLILNHFCFLVNNTENLGRSVRCPSMEVPLLTLVLTMDQHFLTRLRSDERET